MRVLVLNAGSSSLKYDVWDTSADADRQLSETRLAKGVVERVHNMEDALDEAFQHLAGLTIEAVGHRVVHGGELFHESILIDNQVEHGIETLSALAPLHNPHNLEGVRAARRRLPGVPQAAVFDTAFHRTLPRRAWIYGLPWEYAVDKHIRRYGFHGISHRYVSWKFAQLHGGQRSDYRMITCHLGNGASVCAIEHGESIDTSMGFTPVEGLIMGSRSGDVDAGAILHIIREERIAPSDVLDMLNSESGLKGLSGISNDMRDIEMAAREGNDRACAAVDAFCYRVKKYIGSYLAAMNGADALIFTAGIGENSPLIRSRICAGMENLGICIDRDANERKSDEARQISTNSQVQVWVVPTEEEALIARDTVRCVLGMPHE